MYQNFHITMDNQTLKDHFARYSHTNVVYESGDTLYLTHSAALSYGNGTVRTINRSEVFAESHSNGVQILSKEQLSTMRYAELKALAKAANIAVANTKKETLIAALSASKND